MTEEIPTQDRREHRARSSPGPRVRQRVGSALPHVVLLTACFLAIAPFVWSFFGSFKPFRELVSTSDLLPHTWTLNGYIEIITRAHFPDAFLNTVLIASIVTGASLFTSSTLGYIFSKYRFPGKDLLFGVMLATMMVPFAVLLVPLFITISDFGLVDELGGVIVVSLWTTLGTFLMRQFMDSLPTELIDAARIDGASEWQIYRRVILPLSKAPLAALAVLVFLGSWDSFLWPLVVLTSPDKQTLPLLIAGLRSLYLQRYDLWTAASMLTVIPVMIVYLFGSRYFIRGIAQTGIKG